MSLFVLEIAALYEGGGGAIPNSLDSCDPTDEEYKKGLACYVNKLLEFERRHFKD